MTVVNGVERDRRNVAIHPARVGLSEEKRRDWVIDAEDGTTLDDIQNMNYWAHVAKNFTMFDRIEVRLETGAWVAELIVTEVGLNFAKVFMTAHYDLTKTARVDRPEEYRIEFKGPHLKHQVIRNTDNQVVQSGLPKKSDAEVWLHNHMQVVAAA